MICKQKKEWKWLEIGTPSDSKGVQLFVFILDFRFEISLKAIECWLNPLKARRDAKRAKKAEKEAKFLARMEEKKASGEWVEKTKWKAMERKAAQEKKNADVNEDDSDEETEKRPKKVRKRQQKKKKPQKAVENAPPAAKKAKVEAWHFCANLIWRLPNVLYYFKEWTILCRV